MILKNEEVSILGQSKSVNALGAIEVYDSENTPEEKKKRRDKELEKAIEENVKGANNSPSARLKHELDRPQQEKNTSASRDQLISAFQEAAGSLMSDLLNGKPTQQSQNTISLLRQALLDDRMQIGNQEGKERMARLLGNSVGDGEKAKALVDEAYKWN